MKEIIQITKENLEDDDDDDDVEQIQEKLESLQEEVEVQKMLCNMSRKRAEEAETSLEAEINLASEYKRKVIDLEIKLEQALRDLTGAKEAARTRATENSILSPRSNTDRSPGRERSAALILPNFSGFASSPASLSSDPPTSPSF
eukprot:TRINITY_DN651_c0_g1_i1.p1 TRINITY_DN651_c0_g1~~TRINITY_DN651_c0_g1_i1.p1  ORF type:complete len:163 (+),score=55.59 TRINITY_DN651_c0_g1_i1:56-490(+)